MAKKRQIFNFFVSGIPMITLDKLTGRENYMSWVDSVGLWFIGNGCEVHLTTADTNIPEDKRSQWRKIDVLLCNILRQSIDAKALYNIGNYKTCYTLWNWVKKLYTNDIQRLYRVISSIANLKQLDMDISSYRGWMSTLKDELTSILPKFTNTETSQSKIDRVFMIILMLNPRPDFENIRDRILTGTVIPTFDEALARLRCHSSTTTSPCDLRLH